MATFTVPITGPDGGKGTITVNASDAAAAVDNAKQGGNTPTGSATLVGGTPSAPSSPSNPSTPSNPNGPVGTNPAVDQAILNNLQQKAQQEYLNAKLALDTDQEAYQKAAQSIANDLSVAGATGTYNGMPTQAAIKQLADIAQQQAGTMLAQAQAFGTWGAPQQGQQTLAAQQQAFDQASKAAELTGWYTPPTYSPVPPITQPATVGGTTAATIPAAGAAASAAPAALTQASYMTARTAQLQQNGMSQQQAQQTAQSEWAQGYAQSGNVAYGMPSGLTATPAAATGGTASTWQAPTSAQWMTARVAQLQQNGQSAQQATQTAQAEWAQGFAQSGNVAYGMPQGISFTAPAAQAATPAAGGTSSQDQYTSARIAQLQGTGMSATQAAQTAQAEWAQGYAQSGNVAYGMPSTTAPAAATTPATTPPASATGQPGGQPVQTLAAWQAQQTAAQNYLTMMAGLRGPADYAKYQQVLGSTPGGMKDLVAAAAGQYIPGGGATTGVQPTAVNMSNFLGSATGGQPTDPSGQAAMNSLVAPNQMAPQTWNNLTPSQQQLLLGQWESQGYTKDDAQALFNQSLPKYAPQTGIGAGTFKLQ
jgi:hypothetical protein